MAILPSQLSKMILTRCLIAFNMQAQQAGFSGESSRGPSAFPSRMQPHPLHQEERNPDIDWPYRLSSNLSLQTSDTVENARFPYPVALQTDQPNDDDNEEVASENFYNGIEPVDGSDDSESIFSAENASSLMLNQRERTMEAANKVMDDIRNSVIAYEDPKSILRRFERPAHKSIRRTYVDGKQVHEIIPDAPILSVGLMFLPGADKPMANRLEEQNMTTAEPLQRDPHWRVQTAASLLSKFDVDQNLDIVKTDMTRNMQERARLRILASKKMPALLSAGPPSHVKDSARVTIDSDQVKIVRDLGDNHGENFDIEATLIEVDEQSMMTLLVGFRRLVTQKGAALSLEDTQGMLSSMVEEVRRLCVRSALLFRLSTRAHIIKSKNTRYGYNRGNMFLTLTTSAGIREMISMSASFYNTLDSNVKLQAMLRPRFLQMLVVLLSLLNDVDLKELKSFIEHTYHIMVDRPNMEILILQVLPMASINAFTFMANVIPRISPGLADEEFSAKGTLQAQRSALSSSWDKLLKHLLCRHYFLPGSVSQLGGNPNSWSVIWPEGGIKSSSVFKHLQYSDSEGGVLTFNQIPRVEEMMENESVSPDITVLLTNNRKYVIQAPDYDRILCLVPGNYLPLSNLTLTADQVQGVYVLKGAESGSKPVKLHIQEQKLNESARSAVKVTNQLIDLVNHCLANTRRPSRSILSIRSSRKIINRLHKCRTPGVLSRCIATLDENMNALAVAYKRDGNKLQAHSAEALLMEDTREVIQVVDYYNERAAGTKLDRETQSKVGKVVESIRNHLGDCRTMEKSFDQYRSIPDETIADVIQAPGNDMFGQQIWYRYTAEFAAHGNSQLMIEGQWAKVSSVEWLSGAKKLVDVQLHGENLDSTAKYTLEPLAAVDDGCEDDEIKPGDQAVLVGKYLIVADKRKSEEPNTRTHGGPDGLFLENCLRIVSIEQKVQSKRGQNRDSRRGNNRSSSSTLQRRVFI
jgi:hypothetical protein